MPLPGTSYYEEPPRYGEIHPLLVPPPLPPRKLANSAIPALPPRPNDIISCGEMEDSNQKISPLDKSNGATLNFTSALPNGPPLSTFSRKVHEVSLPANMNNDKRPVETNKFYGNMLIGSQTNPVWTHPYSLWWSKDPSFLGIAVAHIQASQRVYGPGSPPQYFFNPTGIKSFVFSSAEFSTQNISLGFASLKHMSAQVSLQKNENQYIRFPLVQGMGFVTAVYHNLVPKIQSAVGFRNFKNVSFSGEFNKYEIMLENNVKWLLYVTTPTGQFVNLNLQDSNLILGSNPVTDCVFQIVADTASEIDLAAGCYPVDCSLSCSSIGSKGSCSFNYSVAGSSKSGNTLMYALPHHMNSFKDVMSSRKINSQLDSTICGKMSGYLTNIFDMEVLIPNTLEFTPSTAILAKRDEPKFSHHMMESMKRSASLEVNGDLDSESDIDSMYFSGKVLAKYAWILFCCQYILKDAKLVSILLPKLKAALGRFIKNNQKLPLIYDTTWGGLISSGMSSQDFGNSYYNDHHFHYSYHIISAAILAKVDQDFGKGDWLLHNRFWVEDLIRDYANPSEEDKYFPVFRSFDWFNGHSWAKGLFESGDGKDQESSSEDTNASYALKLWGLVTNNSTLIEIGNLQLGILRTSLNSYFLYSNDNKVMPPAFIPNKVSGILFENKVDHTTYFGNELQYIQMIHAIPITSASSFIRLPTFVKEEWEEKLSAIVDGVNDGWKGIIMLNVALYNPQMSYAFFSHPSFNNCYLDNGQSLTWSLFFSGSLL